MKPHLLTSLLSAVGLVMQSNVQALVQEITLLKLLVFLHLFDHVYSLTVGWISVNTEGILYLP